MSDEAAGAMDSQCLLQMLDGLQAELVERKRAAAALALENAELRGELQWRRAERESLGRVLRRLPEEPTLVEVLDTICDEAQGLVGATGSAILLLTDPGWLEVAHSTGQPLTIAKRLPVDGSWAGQVVRQGDPVLLGDPACFEPARAPQWPADITALLMAPLRADGEVIGVLDVVNRPGGFSQEDVRVLAAFADQVALVIEHARLQQQAEELAVLRERQKLAREIHASVPQSLYSVTLYANAASLALAAGKYEAAAGFLQALQETAQESMRDMRLLIFQLHPPVLEQVGLAAALQARLAAVEGGAGLQTTFRVDGERRLPVAIEAELYQIAEEALANMRQHAVAGHVTVHLDFTETAVCLEVHDGGAGLDPEAVYSADGGWGSIAERAARLGGRVSHASQPDGGMWVRVEAPL